MLILTRRADERLFIGDDVVISVLDIEGNRVKLGIDAPREVSILREEVRLRGAAVAANEPLHIAAEHKQSLRHR